MKQIAIMIFLATAMLSCAKSDSSTSDQGSSSSGGTGSGSGGSQSIPGTYSVTGVLCNAPASPAAATGVMSTWITGGSTLTFTLTASSATTSWSNGSCTLTQSAAAAISGTTVTLTNSGTYTCTGTGCAAYVTSLFGFNLCGSANTDTDVYTYSVAGGVAVGGTANLTQTSSTAPTCSSLGQTNYLRLSLSRTQ